LNKAINGFSEFDGKTIEEILKNINTVPTSIKQQVINHGGGHANHSLFWKLLSPVKTEPQGKLEDAINSTFGSLEKFKEAFTQKSMSLFGSGWTFLIFTKDNKLDIKRHSFQNSPLSYGNTPIITIDLWEHAYYLKYQNRRAEYIEAWWNVVNWVEASEIFSKAN
jgi:Fe-Mn family superoxide dismutase